MSKIKAFEKYQQIFTNYIDQGKKIENLKMKIKSIQNKVDNFKLQKRSLELLTSPTSLLKQDSVEVVKQMSEEVYNEMLKVKNQYIEVAQTNYDQITQYEFEEKEKIEYLNRELEFRLEKLRNDLEKFGAEKFEELDVETINKWLQTSQEDEQDDYLQEISNEILELTDENQSGYQPNEKDIESTEEMIKAFSISNQINNALDWLNEMNYIPETFNKKIATDNMIDLTEYKSTDQVIDEINLAPNLFKTDIDSPEWLQWFSRYFLPTLFILVSGVIMIVYSGVAAGLSTAVVSIGGILLNYVIPLLIAYGVFRLIYYVANQGMIKSGAISAFIGLVVWWLLSGIEIPTSVLEMLTVPIIILVVVAAGNFGEKLNSKINGKIEDFFLKQSFINSKKKTTLHQKLEQNFEQIYLASNLNKVARYLVEQEYANRREDNETRIAQLKNEKENTIENNQWALNLKAREFYENLKDDFEFINQTELQIEDTRKKYSKLHSAALSKRKITLSTLLKKYDSEKSNWLPVLQDAINNQEKYLSQANEQLNYLTQEKEKSYEFLLKNGVNLLGWDVEIEQVKGQFPDRLYLFQGDKLDFKSRDELVVLKTINHNQMPLVFLYDYDENANLSEKLYNFIQLLYAGFSSIYPLDNIDFIITDFQNHALNFKGQERDGLITIINDVTVLSNKISSAMSYISKNAKSLNEYNLKENELKGNAANYRNQIISYFIIPEINQSQPTQIKFNEDIWRNINNGSSLGYLPIFFVSKDNWLENEKTSKITILNRIKNAYGSKEANVFILDKLNKIKEY